MKSKMTRVEGVMQFSRVKQSNLEESRNVFL